MGRARSQTWPAAAMLLAALPVMPDGLTRDPDTDPSSTSGDGCGQTAYALHDARREQPFTWVMNESSVPDYLDRAATLVTIREATSTIALALTDCPPAPGVRPRPPAATYAGPTDREANVTRQSICFPESNTDGVNVVSFGPLPDDVVAVACTYSERDRIWQADVMLNDTAGLFTLDPEGECGNAFDLQSVMTHEWGHSLGLGHVAERPGTDALTMSSAMGRCDSSARTLGKGDLLGLAVLY